MFEGGLRSANNMNSIQEMREAGLAPEAEGGQTTDGAQPVEGNPSQVDGDGQQGLEIPDAGNTMVPGEESVPEAGGTIVSDSESEDVPDGNSDGADDGDNPDGGGLANRLRQGAENIEDKDPEEEKARKERKAREHREKIQKLLDQAQRELVAVQEVLKIGHEWLKKQGQEQLDYAQEVTSRPYEETRIAGWTDQLKVKALRIMADAVDVVDKSTNRLADEGQKRVDEKSAALGDKAEEYKNDHAAAVAELQELKRQAEGEVELQDLERQAEDESEQEDSDEQQAEGEPQDEGELTPEEQREHSLKTYNAEVGKLILAIRKAEETNYNPDREKARGILTNIQALMSSVFSSVNINPDRNPPFMFYDALNNISGDVMEEWKENEEFSKRVLQNPDDLERQIEKAEKNVDALLKNAEKAEKKAERYSERATAAKKAIKILRNMRI